MKNILSIYPIIVYCYLPVPLALFSQNGISQVKEKV